MNSRLVHSYIAYVHDSFFVLKQLCCQHEFILFLSRSSSSFQSFSFEIQLFPWSIDPLTAAVGCDAAKQSSHAWKVFSWFFGQGNRLTLTGAETIRLFCFPYLLDELWSFVSGSDYTIRLK
jgi:hypothetical protein